MELTLFAVMLGGRAPGCSTELHDTVFVVGTTIENTYEQLARKWFGSLEGLHLDSWLPLEVVDGHRVTLSPEPYAGADRLYYLNLGGYLPGHFGELHAASFLVGESPRELKKRARPALAGHVAVHTDDFYDVDDCIAVERVSGLYVHLAPTEETRALEPSSAYRIIPKAILSDVAEELRSGGERS